MMISKEMLLLQDVWRQAYRKGDAGLTIEFPSKAGAVRARMQLYNSVKKQKKAEDMKDLELVHAAEELEIVWVNDTTIRLQRRGRSDMMVGLMKVVGKQLDDYVDPEVLESQARLLAELDKLKPPVETPAEEPKEGDAGFEHKANPFYGKR